MKPIKLACTILVVLLLGGCAPRSLTSNMNPIGAPVELTYPESSGTIYAKISIGDYQWAIDQGRYHINYSLKKNDEEHLLWEVEIDADLLRRISNRDNNIITKSDFALFPLQKIHNNSVCLIETDSLGNFLSLKKILDATTRTKVSDPYWHKHYAELFQLLIVPFSNKIGKQGDVISVGKVMIPISYRDYFPNPQVLLSGEKSWNGKEVLVLTHKAKSAPYKSKVREKRVDILDVEMLIDKQTKIVRKAETAYRIGQIYIMIDVKNLK